VLNRVGASGGKYYYGKKYYSDRYYYGKKRYTDKYYQEKK
jgi:hypothetical protein